MCPGFQAEAQFRWHNRRFRSSKRSPGEAGPLHLRVPIALRVLRRASRVEPENLLCAWSNNFPFLRWALGEQRSHGSTRGAFVLIMNFLQVEKFGHVVLVVAW